AGRAAGAAGAARRLVGGVAGRLGRRVLEQPEGAHRALELVGRFGELVGGRRDLFGRRGLLLARGRDLLGGREQRLGPSRDFGEARRDLLDQSLHLRRRRRDLPAPGVVRVGLPRHGGEALRRGLRG